MLFLSDICTNSGLLKIILFFSMLSNIIFVIVPIGLIVMICIDFAKNVISSKDDDMKKNTNTAIKRLIMACSLFFVKVIVSFVISFLGELGVEYMSCFTNATLENIEKYEKIEEEEREQEKGNRVDVDIGDVDTEDPYGEADGSSGGPTGTVKLLIIGNSYTYYNGMGEMIAKMAKAEGKSIVVVRATRGSTFGDDLVKEKLDYCYWTSDGKTNCPSGNGKCNTSEGDKKLSEIVKIDHADLNRAGSWDYIVASSFIATPSENDAIYDVVKDTIDDKKDFIINIVHGVTNSADRYKTYVKNKGFSLLGSGLIFNSYSEKSTLSAHDGSNHPSGRGSYLYALSIYAKIYGVNGFAKSENDSNFIEVYNSDSGTSNEISYNCYKPQNASNSEMSITKSVAKKLQAYVYSQYNEYIYNYGE